MPPSPDRELLTQSAARELLERAGQIDSDSTTVDTLRTAAREAGISEAAFEAALVEMRGKLATRVEPESTRWRKRFAWTIAAVAVLLTVATVRIPQKGGSSRADLYLDHEIIVQCLPMKAAQGIAQTLLHDRGNEVQMAKGSRILRLRATPAQAKMVQSAIESAAKNQSSCDNTPPTD